MNALNSSTYAKLQQCEDCANCVAGYLLFGGNVCFETQWSDADPALMYSPAVTARCLIPVTETDVLLNTLRPLQPIAGSHFGLT